MADGKPYTRVLVWADPHCGHKVGLTHPKYWDSEEFKWGQTQRDCWNFIEEGIKEFWPFEILILNGDAVGGKNKKSGGRQLITSDMKEQCEITKQAILYTGVKKVRMTRGTPYHVGNEDNWENVLCEMLQNEGIDCSIRDHGFYEINGKVFDVKHKLSSSRIYKSRDTAILDEIYQNEKWHLKGVQRLADVIIRSHVHYDKPVMGEYRADGTRCLGLVTPALQGLGDEYGQQQCSAIVDFGQIIVDVYNNGEIRDHHRVMKGVLQSSHYEVL